MKDELIKKSASFFKVVGDETRMKILYTISKGELCVNDIAEAVSMTKSAVSHQLKLLKDENLVKARRDGKNIYYSLDDQHVVDILDIAFKHIEHKTMHAESEDKNETPKEHKKAKAKGGHLRDMINYSDRF